MRFDLMILLAAWIWALSIYYMKDFEIRELHTRYLITCTIGFMCALFCFVVGAYLQLDWENRLMANNVTEQIEKLSQYGKAGPIVLVLRHWPIFLMGISGVVGYWHIQKARSILR